MRVPGHGKYARPERERRFLVGASAPTGDAGRLIEDRYLEGMSLRLRRVSGNGQFVYKLTQKVRPDERDPSEVLVTNMYLTEGEYARLCLLPGRELVKTRVVISFRSREFAVDEFHGRLQGLRLAEVEVPDLTEPLDLPEWVTTEVTADERFSGGHLARATELQLNELPTSARRPRQQ
jgi:CYTH domain-containing protein